MPKALKFPMKLGTAADTLFQLREKRYALQAQVDQLKEHENAVREYLFKALPKSEAEGVAGKLCRVRVVQKTKPIVEDWTKVWAHIKKTGEFELLQKRLSDSSVKERWDSGKEVPGVGSTSYLDISINKL